MSVALNPEIAEAVNIALAKIKPGEKAERSQETFRARIWTWIWICEGSISHGSDRTKNRR